MQFKEVVAAAVLLCLSSTIAAVSDTPVDQSYAGDQKENAAQLIAQTHFNSSVQKTTTATRSFAGNPSSAYNIETTFLIGRRNGDFDWNIASDFSGSNQPNTLSELSYSNLSITEATIDYQIRKQKGALKGIYFETHINVGYIENGVIQDSDYDGDDRSGEFSRSLSNPEGSFTFNFVNAVGITKSLFETWRFTPLIGYAYNVQNFVIRDGEQVLATSRRTPSIGQFNGLDSSYQAQWFGFWLGLITQADFNRHHVTLRSQYHFPEYYAEANWNLRSDFAHPKSFAHFADGNGISVQINYAYQLSKKLKFTATYHNERWQTRNGIDTIYFEDGDTASTRLNATNWKSTGFNIGIVIFAG